MMSLLTDPISCCMITMASSATSGKISSQKVIHITAIHTIVTIFILSYYFTPKISRSLLAKCHLSLLLKRRISHHICKSHLGKCVVRQALSSVCLKCIGTVTGTCIPRCDEIPRYVHSVCLCASRQSTPFKDSAQLEENIRFHAMQKRSGGSTAVKATETLKAHTVCCCVVHCSQKSHTEHVNKSSRTSASQQQAPSICSSGEKPTLPPWKSHLCASALIVCK